MYKTNKQMHEKHADQLPRLQEYLLYLIGSEQQRRWSDRADVQADLRFCCSHMAYTGFLMMWLK